MRSFTVRFRQTLISALLAASCPWASAATSITVDKLEASVNSTIILRSDVEKFRETTRLRGQLDPLFTGTAVASKGSRASLGEIVDFLIDEKLVSQQFPVSELDVEQEINSIQANNRVDRSGLKKALADQGFAFEDYFELIRSSASKRNLIDRDIRTKVTVSDDDVKNYFYNRYARSSTTMAYHLQLIAVPVASYKTPGAAREVAQRALNEIRSGESFEEVSKRVGDAESGGGDLGTITEDQMAPLVREQVKKLKIGEVSDLFGGQSAGAFYILKLVDVKSGDTERLEKMKEQIRNQLAASEYQHQIALWLERQRQSAFIHKADEPGTAGISSKQ